LIAWPGGEAKEGILGRLARKNLDAPCSTNHPSRWPPRGPAPARAISTAEGPARGSVPGGGGPAPTLRIRGGVRSPRRTHASAARWHPNIGRARDHVPQTRTVSLARRRAGPPRAACRASGPRNWGMSSCGNRWHCTPGAGTLAVSDQWNRTLRSDTIP
jgi:hypothetical protein